MGPGKEASMGESSVWGQMTYISFLRKFPSLGKEASWGKCQDSQLPLCGEGWPMCQSYGPLYDYGDILKMLAALKCLFEKRYSALWQRESPEIYRGGPLNS